MKKHNENLDILRVFAALSVVFYHLNLLSSVFDSHYSIDVIQYIFPGHLSVLVFFILSGFVISANTKPLANGAAISTYLKKRVVRIFPIYVIAILLTVLVASGKYPLSTWLSNLFLVSVPLDNVVKENGPLWSLEFEMFFYLIFIFFSYFKINYLKTMGALLVVLALIFGVSLRYPVHPLIISVLIGFLFWITGAWLGTYNAEKVWDISSSRVLSVFLLLFSLQKFNPYEPVIKALHLHLPDYSHFSEYQQIITYFDMYFYPLAIMLILALTHTYIKGYKLLLYSLFIVSTAVMCTIPFAYNWQRMIDKQYIVPALLLTSSIVLWVANAKFKPRFVGALKSVAPVSNISYALYIIHSPLIYAFGLWSLASPLGFLFKIIAFFAVLFGLSYLLEMQYQPIVKNIFFPKKQRA